MQWECSSGTSIGTVVRKLTAPIDIHDVAVATSADDRVTTIASRPPAR